jgi:hypothetical protein
MGAPENMQVKTIQHQHYPAFLLFPSKFEPNRKADLGEVPEALFPTGVRFCGIEKKCTEKKLSRF